MHDEFLKCCCEDRSSIEDTLCNFTVKNLIEEQNMLKEILSLKEENDKLKKDLKFWQNKFWTLFDAINKEN